MGGDPSAPVWNHTPPSAMARPVGHCLPRWEPEDLGPKVQGRGATAPVRSMYVSKGQAHMCRAVRCCGILLLNNLAPELPREPALLFRARGRPGFPENSP